MMKGEMKLENNQFLGFQFSPTVEDCAVSYEVCYPCVGRILHCCSMSSKRNGLVAGRLYVSGGR